MGSVEPKKLALLRILEIFKKHSDQDHPLKQDDIAAYLEKDYGIVIERKAIGRNISLLKEADFDIISTRAGSYLTSREFEDAELKLLIDSVLCSQHINPRQSVDLIERLCSLSGKHFRHHVKNIHTVGDWNKTDNSALFYNIEVVDTAIEQGKMVQYNYNKYGIDKTLHKSSVQTVTPYTMILHNQKYYLMCHNSIWNDIVYHRLDRISNIKIYDKPGKSLREIQGYDNGIDFKRISSAMPYMYSDAPQRVTFTADKSIIDQIIDWFGQDITINSAADDNKINISLMASPNAMEYWAMQYLNHVEITSPSELREKIKNNINAAILKYGKATE